MCSSSYSFVVCENSTEWVGIFLRTLEKNEMRIKVLHTISGLSLNSGGPSTCTYHLLKGLNKSGVQADILTLSPASEEEKIGTDSFIKMVPCDAISPLVYSRNLKHYLQEHKEYDIYHANAIWTLPSHETRVAAKKQDKPFVLAPHGMLYPQALQVSAWKKKIVLPLFQKKDLEMADCLQATCEAELIYMREFGLRNPIAIIPNCLDMPVIPRGRQQENSVRRFAFVGRIHRIKNLDLLMEAWLRLGMKTKDAELLIVGDGDKEYKQELEQLAHSNKLGNIKFLGFLRDTVLQNVLHSLDILVLPSKSENFGMVVPEALIQGVPVIASKGTPWKELQTTHCGWWVESTIDVLSQTLEYALNLDEPSRRKMGEQGRQLVLDNYLVDKVSLKMKQLYESVLTGRKAEFITY